MTLFILPNEVLSQVLKNVQPSGSRYNCLFVSRRFCSLMQPIIYRDLEIPFIIPNRLRTLIRAVTRYPKLGRVNRYLCLGEDPYDSNRSLERIIGGVDINKLFPFLKKLEIFAMTFERTMLYRLFAYCGRAKYLEELVVHYPDLVPLVSKIGGLKRLTWSVTAESGSQVLNTEDGFEETMWIQSRFLESLTNCCGTLEELTLGCVSRHSQWGISDRMEVETDKAARYEITPAKLENLKTFRWVAADGMSPAGVWFGVVNTVLEIHKDQLEELKWDFSSWTYDEATLLERLHEFTNLKRLDLHYTAQSFNAVISGRSDGGRDIVVGSVKDLADILVKWDPRGLKDFRIRFSMIAKDCDGEIKLLQALQRAKSLRSLEISYGVPISYAGNYISAYGDNSHEADLSSWYFDEAQMNNLLKNLPISLESVVIDFDGRHDILDGYRYHQFEKMEGETLPQWDDVFKTKVKEFVSQRRIIEKPVIFDQMHQLQRLDIKGYGFVDGENI
ncbi:hypothetical protein ABW20_dc0104821 [Dactylellina cionopaga]|nr:hypothetical protein ABW20_dc0104821 [Dactylellina cionopaga]